jgi:hypothetical protein
MEMKIAKGDRGEEEGGGGRVVVRTKEVVKLS